MPLTDATLDEIERLSREATPGEWVAKECAVEMPSMAGNHSGLYIVCDARNGREQQARADASLTAALRNACDALVAEVRAARAVEGIQS